MEIKNIIYFIVLAICVYFFIDILVNDNYLDFFYSSDPKIEELIKKVEPIFETDKEYTGNLEPLNRRKILKEIKVFKGDKSYTINKRRVFLCLRDEQDEYYNDNMLIYVFLHELSHVVCDEIGHTKKFNEIFSDILDVAIEKEIWDPNEKIVNNYCNY